MKTQREPGRHRTNVLRGPILLVTLLGLVAWLGGGALAPGAGSASHLPSLPLGSHGPWVLAGPLNVAPSTPTSLSPRSATTPAPGVTSIAPIAPVGAAIPLATHPPSSGAVAVASVAPVGSVGAAASAPSAAPPLPVGSPASGAAGTEVPPTQELEVPQTSSPEIGTVVANPPTLGGPQFSIYDAANGYVYVEDGTGNAVSVISAGKTIWNFTGGVGPSAGAFNPLNQTVFVANTGGTNVSLLQGLSWTASVNIATAPSFIAYDPSDNEMYVTETTSGKVAVLNATHLEVTDATGTQPTFDLFDPHNREVYVANGGSNTVSAICGTTTCAVGPATKNAVVKSAVSGLPGGAKPTNLAFDPASDLLFVVDQGKNQVSCVSDSTNAVLQNFGVGNTPGSIIYDPANGMLYVASTGNNQVNAFSGSSCAAPPTVTNINVGTAPDSLVYDPANGNIFVTNSGSASVSVISGTSVVATLTVQNTPDSITFAANTNNLYVTNQGSNTVSVISALLQQDPLTMTPPGSAPATPPFMSGLGKTVTLWSNLSAVGTGSDSGGAWEGPAGLGCLAPTLNVYGGTGVFSMSCTPTTPGTYTVWMNASDTGGASTGSGGSFTVTGAPSVSVPLASQPNVDVGEPFTFSTTASGGTGTYRGYTWTASSSNLGCALVSSATITCVPSSAAGSPFTVSVFVTDSAGGTSSTQTSAAETVNVDPSVSAPVPSVPSVDVGQTFSFSTTASGGRAPYTSYAWTPSSLNLGCGASSTNTITCTPTAASTGYSVSVKVTDTNGFTSTAATSAPFTVFADPVASAPSPSRAVADVGATFAFTTVASLGTGTYSTYTWSQSGGGLGCTLANAASISCSPTAAGPYTVSVQVRDSNGGTSPVVTSASFTVDGAPTATVPSPSVPSADLSQSVTFSTTAGSGTGTFTYIWTASSGIAGCTFANTSSISCTPVSTGSFTATVSISDTGRGSSGARTSASFTVYGDPSVLVPSSSVGSLDLGQPAFTFTTTASGGSGSYPTYTWTQSAAALGCTLVNAVSISCSPTLAGSYTVSVAVTDSDLFTSAAATSSSFTVYADPTITTPTASTPSVDVGQTLTFSTTSTLGSGGNTYAWSGLPTGCFSSSTNALACTPSAAGTFSSITVTVTDSNGVSVPSSALSFAVDSDPVVSVPSSSVPSWDLGQPAFSFATSATGGSGGNAFTWTQSGAGLGCTLGSASSISCTPTIVGSYTVSVDVTDSNGVISGSATSASLTVYADPTIVTPSGAPGSAGIDVGQTVVLSSTSTLGSGGNTYAWSGLPSGCISASTLALSCTPSASGNFPSVKVSVTDSNGFTLTSSALSYTVDTDPSVSGPSSSVPSWDLGQPAFTFTTVASGGSGGNSFSWSQSSANLGCALGSSSSITCTPTAAGSYTVSVSVTDSNSYTSPSATLLSFIVYVDPTATVPSPNLATVDVGQSLTFSTSAGGGTGTYTTFAWTESAPGLGCTLVSAATVVCVPTTPSTSYAVAVAVTDSNGATSSSAISATYTVYADPSLTTPSPSSATVDLTQSVTFSTTAAGGLAPYPTYTWSDSSANLGCTLANAPSISCTPTVAGTTYTVSVSVTDSDGFTSAAAPSGSYTVFVDPSVAVPSPSFPAADVGQAVTFSTSASGGTGGYTSYTWTESSTNLGCTLGSGASINCVPTATGSTYTVTVSVTDTNGAASPSATSASFSVSSGPLVSVPSPSLPNVDVGQTFTFSTTASAGTGSYATYTWTESSVNLDCVLANSASITCAPGAPGTSYTVTVTVTDSGGVTSPAATSASYTVFSDPSVSTPTPNVASVDLSQSATFSTLASGGSGGDVYTWTPSSANLGCTVANAVSISCTPTVAGSYTVAVSVSDSNGATSAAATSSTFTVFADPSASTPLASVASADVGQTVTFTTTATMGTGTYTTYTWSTSPAGLGCTLVNAPSVVCAPTAGGTSYTVAVSVADSNGVSSSVATSASYTVYADPSLTVPTSTVNGTASFQADVGQALVLSTSVGAPGSGGVATFVWTGLPTGCAGSVAAVSCAASAAGHFNVSVSVSDSNGVVATSPVAELTIFVDPTVATPFQYPATVDVGQYVTWWLSLAGGSGVYANFTWANLPSPWNCFGTAYTSAPFCVPASSDIGTLTVSVQATDAEGWVVVSPSVQLTVYADPALLPTSLTVNGTAATVADLGETLVLSTGVSSPGSGSLSAYTWSGLPSGCSGSGSSVTCVPTSPGTFTASASATDSNGASATSAPVAFTVNSPLLVPIPTSSSPSGDVGQSVVFTVAPLQGTTPYATYGWSGLPASCTGTATPSVTCTLAAADVGALLISLRVTDAVGWTAGSLGAVGLTVFADPSVASPTANRTSADVGQSAAFSVVVSGGSGGLSYVWSGLPSSGCTGTSSAFVTCTFASLYSGTITVSVTDSNGISASPALGLVYTAFPDPAVAAPSASPGTGGIDVGQSATFTTTVVQSGSGGDLFSWSVSAPGLFCPGGSSRSVACTASVAGIYTVRVAVKDSNGGWGSASSASYTVLADPTVLTPVASPSLLDVGSSVTVRTVASGGNASSYTYLWTGLPSGCASTTSSVACALTAAGEFLVAVSATDANGFVVPSGSLLLVVHPALSVSASAVPSSVVVGVSTTFFALTSGGTGSATVNWTFGDGSRGSGATVGHAYATAGTYTARVWVNDTAGASSLENLTVVVVAPVVPPSPWIAGSVTPTGANVYIDGRATSVSAGGFNATVAAGTHWVEAWLTGYEAYSANLTVENGQGVRIAIVLTPVVAPSPAWIAGSLSPSSAGLWVDGSPVALVSGSFNLSLTAGKHFVHAWEAGYSAYSSNVTVAQGQGVTLSISLTAVSSTTKVAQGSGLNAEIPLWSLLLLLLVLLLGIILVGLLVRRHRPRPRTPLQWDEPEESLAELVGAARLRAAKGETTPSPEEEGPVEIEHEGPSLNAEEAGAEAGGAGGVVVAEEASEGDESQAPAPSQEWHEGEDPQAEAETAAPAPSEESSEGGGPSASDPAQEGTEGEDDSSPPSSEPGEGTDSQEPAPPQDE
ncbi:MAG: PEGA domain-containing protein [Euryarchaeota archaeon]|nr:PEGA domain-containing protein [Euryarchaeota archaeon]MDE2043886.1 PEGA domain-containing protein [Thermoplasmata archaeon]